MALFFPFMRQLRNGTGMHVDFRTPVNDEDPDGPAWRLPGLPDLPPQITRSFEQDILLRRCLNRVSSAWKIHVYVDGLFSGTKVPARVFLEHVRIVFLYKTNRKGELMLCVNGVKEKPIDMLYGLRFIGSMLKRDSRWNRRPIIRIYPEDSDLEDEDSDLEDEDSGVEDEDSGSDEDTEKPMIVISLPLPLQM